MNAALMAAAERSFPFWQCKDPLEKMDISL
jgi:hypothetical protein